MGHGGGVVEAACRGDDIWSSPSRTSRPRSNLARIWLAEEFKVSSQNHDLFIKKNMNSKSDKVNTHRRTCTIDGSKP